MEEIVFCLMVFIICYLFYYVFVYRRENVFDKFKDGKEIRYLKLRYKIEVTDDNMSKLANIIFLANSFILSFTLYIISLFKDFFSQIFIGFVVLLALILTIYHFIGTYFKKHGGK